MSYNVLQMKSIAKELNNRSYTDYYYRLTLIALARFKWTNLPNGINEKWIEKYLFTEGKCMFFKDEMLGYMISKCSNEGLNYYDEPTELRPVATNYSKNKSYKNEEDCILISNNDLNIPTQPTIELYAYKLANLDRTSDVNVNAQKTPVVILCSDKQRLSLKNVFVQWNGNEPVIYGDKSLNLDDIKVLKTDAPIVFDKLQIQKHAVWNEVMTFLGVNNANQDKRERLVADEVQSNNEQVYMSADSMLKARKEACKRINKLFNLNIDVELRMDVKNASEGFEEGSEEGSEEEVDDNVNS